MKQIKKTIIINDYLIDILKEFEYKPFDILIYILENTEPANNTFIGTYSKIQENTNCSRLTVAAVIMKLQEKGFIKKIQNGVYQLNSKIIKGIN